MADKKVDKICEDCESNYGYKSLDEIGQGNRTDRRYFNSIRTCAGWPRL